MIHTRHVALASLSDFVIPYQLGTRTKKFNCQMPDSKTENV